MKYQRCQEVQGSQKLHGCHITHVTSETQKRSETCLGARCWRIWESHLLGSSTWKNTQSNRWTNNIRIKEDLNIISIFSMDILGEDGKKKKVTCPSLNHVVRQEYLATSQSLPSWTTSLSPGFFSAFWWLPCLCPALMFTASFSTRLTAGWQLNVELSTASRHRPRSAVSMRRSLEVPSKNLTSRVKSHGSTLSILTGHLMLEWRTLGGKLALQRHIDHSY